MITFPRPELQSSRSPDFQSVADESSLQRAATALEAHGIEVIRAADVDEARRIVLELIPDGATVLQGASRTLEVAGISEVVAGSGRFTAIGPRMRTMDRATQAGEIRRLGAAPDVMLGSVHAVTETGSLVVASATGSQLGPYASGAGKVIFVVGAQKVVADVEEGLRRVHEHVLPLEDARALVAYGVKSSVNKTLIIDREVAPGRITVVLVDEAVGF
jgi:L-lactate utilization protein LutC